MEEKDLMQEDQGTQTNEMGDNAAGRTREQGEKLFTQEEVNGFVKNQVSRMMKKATRDKEAEYDQKFKELEAREMRLRTLEELISREMPKELADIITCKDENDMKAKLDAIQKIYGNKEDKEEKNPGFRQIGVGGNPAMNVAYNSDPVRKAMGLKG